MNDPDDYYHGQPRIDQDVELLHQNGYIGQYYMRRIGCFHELRHLAGVAWFEYASYQIKITQYENLLASFRSDVQALTSGLVTFYKSTWVDWHRQDEERQRLRNLQEQIWRNEIEMLILDLL